MVYAIVCDLDGIFLIFSVNIVLFCLYLAAKRLEFIAHSGGNSNDKKMLMYFRL